jgi:hypothetical protein
MLDRVTINTSPDLVDARLKSLEEVLHSETGLDLLALGRLLAPFLDCCRARQEMLRDRTMQDCSRYGTLSHFTLMCQIQGSLEEEGLHNACHPGADQHLDDADEVNLDDTNEFNLCKVGLARTLQRYGLVGRNTADGPLKGRLCESEGATMAAIRNRGVWGGIDVAEVVAAARAATLTAPGTLPREFPGPACVQGAHHLVQLLHLTEERGQREGATELEKESGLAVAGKFEAAPVYWGKLGVNTAAEPNRTKDDMTKLNRIFMDLHVPWRALLKEGGQVTALDFILSPMAMGADGRRGDWESCEVHHMDVSHFEHLMQRGMGGKDWHEDQPVELAATDVYFLYEQAMRIAFGPGREEESAQEWLSVRYVNGLLYPSKEDSYSSLMVAVNYAFRYKVGADGEWVYVDKNKIQL